MKNFKPAKSVNVKFKKNMTQEECDNSYRKNEINAYVQFIQHHGWTSVESGLPPKGDSLCCIALFDDAASYGLFAEVMNTTWFCANYKKHGWTHWLLLPPRPSEVNNLMDHLFKGKEIERD